MRCVVMSHRRRRHSGTGSSDDEPGKPADGHAAKGDQVACTGRRRHNKLSCLPLRAHRWPGDTPRVAAAVAQRQLDRLPGLFGKDDGSPGARAAAVVVTHVTDTHSPSIESSRGCSAAQRGHDLDVRDALRARSPRDAKPPTQASGSVAQHRRLDVRA
jgi:hypothetical protein